MFFNNLKSRIIFSVLFLYAFLIGLIVTDMFVRQESFLEQQLSNESMTLARTLSVNAPSWMLSHDITALNELLTSLHSIKNLNQAMFLDVDKKVLASTDTSLFNFTISDKISEDLIAPLLLNPEITENQIVHDGLVDSIKSITSNMKRIGYTRVLLDVTPVKNELQVVKQKGIIYTLLAVLIGGLFIWLLVRKVTYRLNILSNAVDSIAKGNLNLSLPHYVGRDEVSRLSRDFNLMAVSLKQNSIERDHAERELSYERTMLENRVTQRTQELNDALDSRRMMVANASHELRTPVNSLRLLVSKTMLTNTKLNEFVPQVKRLTDHMCHVVETLLLLDPDQTMAREDDKYFNLSEEITTASKLANLVTHGSEAEFKIEINECEDISVLGKRGAFNRVIINIISNAWKYTPKGKIFLKASVTRTDNSGISLSIRIVDSGLGIAENMHEKIFETFITADTNNYIGTGLGLPIARKLASDMGGTLELKTSSPNCGSEFEFCVPFIQSCSNKDLNNHISPETDNVKYIRKKVLLAEDDEVTAETLQTIIRLLKHDVAHVKTFKHLSHALNTDTFDVAFVDNRLPGGKGLDAIKAYRQLDHNRTHIVFMTADASPDLIASARIVCDDVSIKPTNVEYIQKILGGTFNYINQNSDDSGDNIIDLSPISKLSHLGLKNDEILPIVLLFYKTIEKTIIEIEKLLNEPTNGNIKINLENIVHRTSGACGTVGAVALEHEFIAMSEKSDIKQMIKSLDSINSVFDVTKKTLDKFFATNISENKSHEQTLNNH